MLKKIEHVGVMVEDMDRSVAFYRDILGLELRDRIRIDSEVEIAFFKIGESEIELISRGAREEGGPVDHLAFTVDDIGGVLEDLRQKGVTLLDQQPKFVESMNVTIAFFLGPDGEKLELVSRT